MTAAFAFVFVKRHWFLGRTKVLLILGAGSSNVKEASPAIYDLRCTTYDCCVGAILKVCARSQHSWTPLRV